MDFAAIGEETARLVDDQRIVVPGVPVAVHHVHELVGAVIAQVVVHSFGAAHVERFAIVERCDDIPGRAAVAHQIQSGEESGDVERLVVGRRVCRPEPQVLGSHAHRHQHDNGVKLDAANAIFDRVRVVVAVAIRHRQPVVEERQVEFPRLEHPGDLAIEISTEKVRPRLRMPPRSR